MPAIPARDKTSTPSARGIATRIQLQESFLELLRTTAWSKLTVIDIARHAKVSPATFYQYHASLDALAMHVSTRLGALNKPVPEHLAKVVALLTFESASELS